MRVLILGANGSIAREATKLFLDETDAELTLHVRDPHRLSGIDLERMAESIVRAMDEADVRRLIFITSMGIYDEVPGQKYSSVLDPYRKAAEVIEASGLDYTILRPAWFTDADEVDYETTQKDEPFKGGMVSRRSVAALVVKLAMTPGLEIRRSLGVSKPQ